MRLVFMLEGSSLISAYNKFSSIEQGLSVSEARSRLAKYGRNKLPQKNHFIVLKNIASQFSDLLVIILLIAGVLSWFLGDMRTAIVMFAVVLLNASIGFWQQYKTEKVLLALKNMLPQAAQVMRGGKIYEILASEIVPGDVVLLQAGDAIPADGLIIESYSLRVNESALTGESNPQTKHVKADRVHPDMNKMFMGTVVLEGQAKLLVTGTGVSTQFGKIAEEAKVIKADISPLQKKLKDVGRTVLYIAATVMVLMIGYQLIKNILIDGRAVTPNFFREVFLFGLALGAALVPEGLPATVSVALSFGASRLAKKNAVVKKLSSVETLGGTQVICTDKTGTLTFGKMSLVSVWPADSITEIGFSNFDIYNFRHLLLNWQNCHNVKQSENGLMGDPNEIAIIEGLFRKKFNIDSTQQNYKRVHEYSFTSIRKMMSVVVEDREGYYLYAKGNPAVLIDKCKLNDEKRKEVMSQVDSMALRGIRVLAFAHRDLIGRIEGHLHQARLMEKDLIFDGLIGIEDDIRPEVPKAIDYCHEAGIRIIMITGDYRVTAEATAKKLNLSGGKEFRVVSGDELYKMSDVELRENLLHECIFYQTDPRQKYRIVETLQNMGLTVAVTGDGVNDALALKRADIGVAMGNVGTDVAKEAADMVLLDDNFATIVNAVMEGRIIWNNLKKFLYYVFSSNAGEFVTALLGVVMGLPMPLTAVQVLGVDLGTDVLPSLALAANKYPEDVLINHQTGNKKENLLNAANLWRLLTVGLVMGGGAVLNYLLINKFGPSGTLTYRKATTAAFATLVICQIANIISVQGGIKNFGRAILGNLGLMSAIFAEVAILLSVIYWPPLHSFLLTSSLSAQNWVSIVSVGIVFLLIEEYRIRNAELKGNTEKSAL